LFFVNKESFLELWNYGIFGFFANIADRIIFFTDTFVIGAFINSVAITYYSIGASVMPYLARVISSVTWPLLQIAIGYDSLRAENEMEKLYMRGSRYVGALVGLIISSLFVAGEDFIKNWMGEKYFTGTPFASSGVILFILLTSHFFFLSQSLGRQIIFARRKNKNYALILGVEAACNLILSIVLVKKYSIVGVAIGTLIPMMITDGIVVPWYVSKLVSVNFLVFLIKSSIPNVILTIIVSITGLAIFNHFAISGWAGVIIKSIYASSTFLILAFIFIIEKDVKSKLVDKIKNPFYLAINHLTIYFFK
jgi:O-antigen/teichoic acid export membrane protein